jgi:hypothetical protein
MLRNTGACFSDDETDETCKGEGFLGGGSSSLNMTGDELMIENFLIYQWVHKDMLRSRKGWIIWILWLMVVVFRLTRFKHK